MSMTSKMTDDEYKGGLKKFKISQTEAVELIYIKTGSVIRTDAVQTHLSRYGHLSAPYSALYRFLFRELENEHTGSRAGR